MAMRPSKNVRSFFGRLNKVNTVILDAYQGYTLTPPDPVADGAGNITLTLNDFNAYKKALVENVVEFCIFIFQISDESSTSSPCIRWIWTPR
jgi:hypothetical protein